MLLSYDGYEFQNVEEALYDTHLLFSTAFSEIQE